MLIMRRCVEDKSSFKVVSIKVTFILCILFVFLEPFSGTSTAHANYDPVISDEDLELAYKPGLVEKHLSKFFLSIANSIIAIAQAQDVSTLVFQRDDVIQPGETWIENKANASREDMIFGIFPSGLFDGIAVFYDLFVSLLTIPIVVLLAVGGLFLMFDIMRSAESKSSAKEMTLGVIIAILLIRFGHIAWDWIIFINYIIVDGIYLKLAENGIHVTSFLSTIWDPTSTESVTKSPSFMIALIVLCSVGFTFTMNYQYMVRMIILGALIILFPGAILSAVIPSRRSVLNTWFTTFTSQIFIQASHAIALGIFFFALAKANFLGFWFVLTMFFALPTVSGLVQSIVSGFTGEGGGGGGGGFKEHMKANMQGGSGIGGLMAVASIGRGILGKGTGGKSGGANEGIAGTAGGGMNNSGGSGAVSSGMSGTGVGSAPIGNSGSSSGGGRVTSGSANSAGTGANQRPRGLARIGSGIASGSKRLANSQGFRRGATAAMAVSGAAIGSVAGTMTTGRASGGMAAGAIIGAGGGKVASYATRKGAKGTQVVGEVIKSKAQGGNAFDATKERLGFKDTSQISDPAEMKRMGNELLGGKTGEMLGSVVGSSSYYTDKFAQSSSEPAQERYESVNERRDLAWDIDQKSAEVEDLGNQREMAAAKLDAAYAQHGGKEAVGRNLPGNVVAAKDQYEKIDSNYKTAKYEQMQLQQKHENFHAIKSHAKETKNLQNERASSGAI